MIGKKLLIFERCEECKGTGSIIAGNLRSWLKFRCPLYEGYGSLSWIQIIMKGRKLRDGLHYKHLFIGGFYNRKVDRVFAYKLGGKWYKIKTNKNAKRIEKIIQMKKEKRFE